MLTIEPPPDCLIAGMADLQPRNVPSELMSLTRRYSASVQSSIELRTPTPAAFSRPCSPPNLSTLAPTALCQPASWVTSRVTNSAASPSSAASARPLPSSRSASTALPPSRTTSRALSAPMPDAPPLTSTTLFSRRGVALPFQQAGRHPAVGHDLRAGDEARTVRAQPQHDLAQIDRLGHAPDRMARTGERLAFRVAHRLPQRFEDRRIDAAGMHRIAADVVSLLGAVERHALAEQPHCALAGGIGGWSRRADQAGDRRDVDDRALGCGLVRTGPLHALGGAFAAQEHAFGIDRLHMLPLLDGSGLRIRETAGDAGIVDHDVQAAFACQHVGERAFPGPLRGDVVRHESAGAVPGVLKVGDDDTRALARKQRCRRGADTRSAARDDGHLSRKFPAHAPTTIAIVVQLQ